MESRKNIVGAVLLVALLLTFVIGGFFLTRYLTTDNKQVVNNNSIPATNTVDLRIDKTKDYIYYDNEKEIIEEEEIVREDAFLNFSSLSNINEELKREADALYNEVVYRKDVELPLTNELGEPITYNENEAGIYSIKYRNYENYKYNDYISLVVLDYSYDIIKASIPLSLKSYVVDIKTGVVISKEELFSQFGIDENVVREKIKTRLEGTQVLDEAAAAVIDINGTLADLNYTVYINKNGKLEAAFIVKSQENNYNDTVVLN